MKDGKVLTAMLGTFKKPRGKKLVKRAEKPLTAMLVEIKGKEAKRGTSDN